MPESLLTSRRRLLQAGGSLMLLMLSGASLAGGAGVIAVRSWPSATYTRITLESDGALKYRSFTMSSPNRLVIDLEGVQLNAVLREFSERAIDDPYIRTARAGQFNPTTVRVVLDLKSEVRPEIFTLAPIAE